jgi:hypothetical protein
VNIIDSTLSTNTTFSGNAGAGGNGVFNSAGGMVNIVNSTISENFDGFRGGGVHNEGTVNARNTIIANNSTRSGIGQDFNGTPLATFVASRTLGEGVVVAERRWMSRDCSAMTVS